jgi:molybdopterin-guanine dinucleotide biosynthesis protein A
MNISGVILAGGENSRFGGKSKAGIEIGGKRIITRIIDTISGIFGEIVIVSNSPIDAAEVCNYKTVKDIIRHAGPLGGIHAGICASSNEYVFVFACDMPFLDKQLINRQIELAEEGGYDAVVPLNGDKPEPLHSVYRTSILPNLEKFLSEPGKPSIIRFLSGLKVNYMNVENRGKEINPFTNINYPSDLEAIKDQMKDFF